MSLKPAPAKHIIDPRERLIVALDVETPQAASKLVTELGDSVSFYKIGLELLYAGGMDLAQQLIKDGKQVFIDAKLHDIPNTVERAARQLSKLGASLLTVHAYPHTMEAALKGRGGSKLKIIGVTVLTSMSDDDVKQAGYGAKVADIVAQRVLSAKQLGMDGIVCSPMEAKTARDILGLNALIVTPGIRLGDAKADDQARIATPTSAIENGASHLVVGRPITQSDNPKRVAMEIAAQIGEALS